MTKERLALGQWGEDQAARFLRRLGMKIVGRNVRTPVGELDIIARERKTLVFVEVKTRRGGEFGSPQEAVNRFKQRQIIRSAQWYLNQQDCQGFQPRFDVIAVRQIAEQAEIDHIIDAFGV